MSAPGSDDPQKEAQEAQKAAEFEKLRSELARLKAKRAQSKDKDINSVLDMRINQIEVELPPSELKALPKVDQAKVEEELALEELAKLPPPSAKEAEEAERLIRQARLEKQRGNNAGASDLFKKASEVAPSSPVVLEALGDDYAMRKLGKQARIVYKQALALDPKNVGLERKYAELVLLGTANMSFDEAMRSSDSLFMTGDEHIAASWALIVLTAVLPGVGQMVAGKTVKGIILFVLYVIFSIWATIMKEDIFSLMKSFKQQSHYSSSVFIPMAGLTVVWLIAVGDLWGKSKAVARPRGPIERPRPPVDLPFD